MVRIIAVDEDACTNRYEIEMGETHVGKTGVIVNIDPPEKRFTFPIDVDFGDGEILGFTANEIEVIHE
jgi:hypothetical protein